MGCRKDIIRRYDDAASRKCAIDKNSCLVGSLRNIHSTSTDNPKLRVCNKPAHQKLSH